jgi:hypothetical protein
VDEYTDLFLDKLRHIIARLVLTISGLTTYPMPTFQVAHVREQGVDLIIIPVESAFGVKNQKEQHQIFSELQIRANNAGLAGTVVPVWDGGGGRLAFLAPTQWHSFFRSLTLQWVAANINKSLYW